MKKQNHRIIWTLYRNEYDKILKVIDSIHLDPDANNFISCLDLMETCYDLLDKLELARHKKIQKGIKVTFQDRLKGYK